MSPSSHSSHRREKKIRNRMETRFGDRLQWGGKWQTTVIFIAVFLNIPSVRGDKHCALPTGFRSHPILDPLQSGSLSPHPRVWDRVVDQRSVSRGHPSLGGICLGFLSSSRSLLLAQLLRQSPTHLQFTQDTILLLCTWLGLEICPFCHTSSQ